MKCLMLIAALCCLGVCSGQSLDFLTDNILNPMLDQIYGNAINLLGQQINNLFGGLFGGIGKRGLNDVLNVNINQILAPFIGQIKDIYQHLFTVFLQIVQHAEAWIGKADWARIEFVRAGAEAEEKLSHLHLSATFLQPLVGLVQQHLSAFITTFEAIVVQVLNAAKPLQSLIGAGNLLQP